MPNQKPMSPSVMFPTVRVPQPDGSVLFRPGRPVETPDVIDTDETARLLGISADYVAHLCADGCFPGAYKPSGKPKGKWLIPRHLVLARLQPANP